MALKKEAKTIFLLAMLLGLGSLNAADSRMMILSIQLPPPDVTATVEKDLLQKKGDEKIKKMGSLSPDKFAKKMVKGLIPGDLIPQSTSGIMALYAGYVTYSDKMGMITFPLRHAGKKVEVVATPSMDMNRLYKETFSGVFISQKNLVSSGAFDKMPPQKFVFSQVEDSSASFKDAEKKDANAAGGGLGSWKIEKSNVPLDTQLPQETVILLINPKNLFVPQGTFVSMTKPHIVLPDMYLIGKTLNDAVLLNNQKNVRYFEEVVIENGTVVQKEKNMEIHQSAVVND